MVGRVDPGVDQLTLARRECAGALEAIEEGCTQPRGRKRPGVWGAAPRDAGDRVGENQREVVMKGIGEHRSGVMVGEAANGGVARAEYESGGGRRDVGPAGCERRADGDIATEARVGDQHDRIAQEVNRAMPCVCAAGLGLQHGDSERAPIEGVDPAQRRGEDRGAAACVAARGDHSAGPLDLLGGLTDEGGDGRQRVLELTQREHLAFVGSQIELGGGGVDQPAQPARAGAEGHREEVRGGEFVRCILHVRSHDMTLPWPRSDRQALARSESCAAASNLNDRCFVVRWALVVTLLAACGPAKAPENSGSGGSGGSAGAGSETLSTPTTSTSTQSSGSDELASSTVSDGDAGGPQRVDACVGIDPDIECSLLLDNCPAGQRCARDGITGKILCWDIDPNPRQLGEPCEYLAVIPEGATEWLPNSCDKAE